MKLKLISFTVLVGLLSACGTFSGPSKPEPSAVTSAINQFAKQHDVANALDITDVETSTSGRLISLKLSHKGFTYTDETGSKVTIPSGTGSASVFNREGKWVLDQIGFQAGDGSYKNFEPSIEVK